MLNDVDASSIKYGEMTSSLPRFFVSTSAEIIKIMREKHPFFYYYIIIFLKSQVFPHINSLAQRKNFWTRLLFIQDSRCLRGIASLVQINIWTRAPLSFRMRPDFAYGPDMSPKIPYSRSGGRKGIDRARSLPGQP